MAIALNSIDPDESDANREAVESVLVELMAQFPALASVLSVGASAYEIASARDYAEGK